MPGTSSNTAPRVSANKSMQLPDDAAEQNIAYMRPIDLEGVEHT